MINPVEKFIPDYIKAGADIITIHEEINDDVENCLKLIREAWSKNRYINQTKNIRKKIGKIFGSS